VKCEHTPCPEGYLEWHSWAKRMAKTHRQVRCPGCGLWKVWVLKPNRVSQGPAKGAGR
jgi:hypothetical protein